MKPHRKVCMAQWSGIREFEASGQKVVTGCTSLPLPKKTCCGEHEGEQTPVADNVSAGTRKTLKDYKEKTKQSEQTGDDHIYIIESIQEFKEDEGKNIFKVKWFGFPDEAATWEPVDNIPKFIQDYYIHNQERLGNKLPNPRIKCSKKLSNGTKYHYLTWDGEAGGKWLTDDFFKMANGDDEDDFGEDSVNLR